MDALYDGIVGAVGIKQCQAGQFLPNSQQKSARYSGGLDPQQIYVMMADPRFNWTSFDVAGIVSGISCSTGLAVASGTVTLPWQRRAQGGSFAGSSSHFIVTGSNGLAIPRSISASDDLASVNLDFLFRSTDGITAPVTTSVNTTLGAQAFNASHVLGKVFLNSTLLEQVKSVTINPGIQASGRRFGGRLYPEQIHIDQRDPTIDVTFCDLDAMNDYGPLFAAMTAGVVYLRKKSDGGSFVADDTGAHVSFTFGAGLMLPQQISGSGNGDGEGTIRLFGKALTTSVTATIPADS